LTHKNLSEDDLPLLAGTDLMTNLQRNRLVIVYDPKDKRASMEELGLYVTEGLFYVRNVQENRRNSDTIEILFELKTDLENTMQYLTQFKLGQE
jgi:hypothetical protein